MDARKAAIEKAMWFIAAYDTPSAGEYEKHVAHAARTWLRILRARHPVRAIVAELMDELNRPVPSDYGCGWEELRREFGNWAKSQGLFP